MSRLPISTKFNSRLPLQTSDELKSVNHHPNEPSTASRTTSKNPCHTQFSKRRSKSASDLRTSTSSMSDTKKSITGKVVAPGNAKASKALKRPAPTGAEKCENAKPKTKMPKIPDWDYKTRFTVLTEKHNILVNSHKEAKEKLKDLATVEEDHNRITSEVDRLTRELDKCQRENEELQIIKKQHDLLKVSNKACKAQLEQVMQENNCLSKQNKLDVERFENLQSKLNDLTKDWNALTEKHKNLLERHGTLVSELDHLKHQYNSTNEQLIEVTKTYTMLQEEVLDCKKKILSNEALRRKLHNTIQDLKGNIRVFCRVRPPINEEENKRLQCYIKYPDECSMKIRKSKESLRSIAGKPIDQTLEFSFDRIFQPSSTQGDIFEELAQLVQSALDGYNVCVFAYGQTGSGKTYTMHGEPPDQLGMIPKSVDMIFETVKELEKIGWQYKVEASCLEIYNETIRDLLQPGSTLSYDIQYNEGSGTSVKNLMVKTVSSAQEMKQLMCTANRNRAIAVTDMNEHSSRSHSVTQICVRGCHKGRNIQYYGSVNLVDLAGSERSKAQSEERFKETVNINQSLSALGNVMLALHNKDSHVPYRNSKLTYLLQPCLGGNSKTLMIVNISPFEDCYGESASSLRFAAKVKEVKIASKRNRLPH